MLVQFVLLLGRIIKILRHLKIGTYYFFAFNLLLLHKCGKMYLFEEIKLNQTNVGYSDGVTVDMPYTGTNVIS